MLQLSELSNKLPAFSYKAPQTPFGGWLCRQAFGGRNFRMVGIVYQRALILTIVVSALVALVWTRASQLLLLFR